jgi:hypothetical protein
MLPHASMFGHQFYTHFQRRKERVRVAAWKACLLDRKRVEFLSRLVRFLTATRFGHRNAYFEARFDVGFIIFSIASTSSAKAMEATRPRHSQIPEGFAPSLPIIQSSKSP